MYIKHDKNVFGLKSVIQECMKEHGHVPEETIFSHGCLTFINPDGAWQLAAIKRRDEEPFAKETADGSWVRRSGESGAWVAVYGIKARLTEKSR